MWDWRVADLLLRADGGIGNGWLLGRPFACMNQRVVLWPDLAGES